MAKARFKCQDDSFYDAAGRLHYEFKDPHGNEFVATGNGSEALNAALNECAKANLGSDAIAPVNWLKVVIVGGVLFGLASAPWIYWRIRGGPNVATER